MARAHTASPLPLYNIAFFTVTVQRPYLSRTGLLFSVLGSTDKSRLTD